MSTDTKDPNYTYKVLAQTLAANVHNDKLSDAAFRQFVTNCVQEFMPPRDASRAVAHAEQFGAKKEMQLRTDIWQFEGSTVYKLQEAGRRGAADQFQNEYVFNVQYIPLRGDGSSQAERDSRKEKMAQHIVSALNALQGEGTRTEPSPGFTYDEKLSQEIWVNFNKPRPHNGLGYCPVCGCPGTAREKRPDGDDICENNHRYPSATAQYQDKEKS